MIACPRCDAPLTDDDRCPACSAGPEREHDPLDAPEQTDPRDDGHEMTEAEESAAWGDPRPMPEWRD